MFNAQPTGTVISRRCYTQDRDNKSGYTGDGNTRDGSDSYSDHTDDNGNDRSSSCRSDGGAEMIIMTVQQLR